MLKLHLRKTISLELFFLLPKSPSPSPPHSIAATRAHPSIAPRAWPISMKLGGLTATTRPVPCFARRRSVRYGAEDGGDEEVEEGEDGYGDNAEIGLLELYSQSAKGEALIVHADIDGDQVEVLIFKGFSSSLSYGTWSDPSRSILPARAKITSIDRVKGPFDPSNIEFIQKGLTWENFKAGFIVSR